MQSYELVPRFTSEQIQTRLDELAGEINRDYEGSSLVVIGILKGAFMFVADLVRRLSVPVEVDFVRLASYGNGSQSSGQVCITKDIELPINGRHVLVVEDIVDSGITLVWYKEHLKRYEPASIKLCAMIDKYERREKEIQLDYVGLRLESGFLVGYGLDYSERYRNLPAIYEVEFK